MGADSRRKGAGFEREIARELNLLTGIKFQRNLEQTRAADHGDLIADDPAWPFVIECKRRNHGASCLTGWKVQSVKAAQKAGKLPAVVYKFDRQPIRVAVPISAICSVNDADEWAEITLTSLAYLAREIMAGAEE